MKKVYLTIVTLSLIFFSASSVPAGEVMVIINNAVKTKPFTKKMASDIYLGNKTRWDDGRKIVIVLLRQGETHKKFTNEILNIAPEKLGRFWKRAYFAGSCSLPKICKTEEKLIEVVTSYPGAIGYIDSETPHETVMGYALQ